MTQKPGTPPAPKTPRKKAPSTPPAVATPGAKKAVTASKKAAASGGLPESPAAETKAPAPVKAKPARLAKPKAAGRPVKAKTGSAKPKAKPPRAKSSKGGGPSPSKRTKKAPVRRGQEDPSPAQEATEPVPPAEPSVEGPESYWARQSAPGESREESARDPQDHFKALQPMTQQFQDPQSFRDLVTQSIEEQPSLGWEKKLLAKWANRKKK